MRHAPQPLLWSPPASAAAAMSQRHPSASLRSIDRRSKSASDPRTLLAPPPIPAATPAASSALQCAEKRRGGVRPAMDDEGSAGRASAGPVAPSARGTCRRPADSRRATAAGGAVGAAAAAPPVGGELGVAWAALRRRSGRPGSGGSLRRHGFKRGSWLRAGLPGFEQGCCSFFCYSKQNSSQLRKLKRAGWKH